MRSSKVSDELAPNDLPVRSWPPGSMWHSLLTRMRHLDISHIDILHQSAGDAEAHEYLRFRNSQDQLVRAAYVPQDIRDAIAAFLRSVFKLHGRRWAEDVGIRGARYELHLRWNLTTDALEQRFEPRAHDQPRTTARAH